LVSGLLPDREISSIAAQVKAVAELVEGLVKALIAAELVPKAVAACAAGAVEPARSLLPAHGSPSQE
jgi:hypothetical protein